MIKGGNNKRFLAVFIVSLLLIAGCSSSNGTANITNPYETQDASGVWLGYIGNAFVIGIITTDDNENYSGRFMGQYNESKVFTQFLTPDGSYLTQTPETAIYTGTLEECVWDTTGPDYYNKLPLQTLSILSSVSAKSVFGGPLFSSAVYNEQPYIPEQIQTGELILYYNTTYDLSPNVNNLSGQWEITNILTKGNTLILTITPDTAGTNGTTHISGSDTKGNQFDGTITIHVTPVPHNIYDVSLKMNNSIDLTGLVTYVLEETSAGEGISLPQKTLVIGATDKDKNYSLSGLANKKE
ncbi:MAG: hypothetical protein ABSA71_13935 [Desulfomonilia bacterium]|jgi:hypothetical protein